jgi:hypothetical protein
MRSVDSTIRKIHTMEEAAGLCGLDDPLVRQWFFLNVGLLGIVFPGKYWHDVGPNERSSLMNVTFMMESGKSGDALSFVWV